MSSNSGQIGRFALELLALEHRKTHIWSCPEDGEFSFDRIFIKLAGKEDNHKISDEFEFGPDWTVHFGVIRLIRSYSSYSPLNDVYFTN